MTELEGKLNKEGKLENPDVLAQEKTLTEELKDLQDPKNELEGLEKDDHNQEDFSHMDKAALIKKAESLLQSHDIRKSNEYFKQISQALQDMETAERPSLIKAWTEAGNDPRDFVAVSDEFRKKYLSTVQLFKKKREDERIAAEEERLVNLKSKEAVLDKMKAMLELEETLDGLKQFRGLINEWREIRQVPKEFKEELDTRFEFYMEKYYDTRKLHQELFELDREKNLEAKIDLIKKAELLKNENSFRKALVSLNKYHDDWRTIGPVRKEISEEIWSRFKAISDEVIAEKKAVLNELNSRKEENLKLKQLLIEKSEEAIAVLPLKTKQWNDLTKELDGYFEDWKNIGPVPKEHNESSWAKFSSFRNQFYSARKDFFEEIHTQKDQNLKLKEELCLKAEALQDANDFKSTSDALTLLQEEWKSIGPVSENVNQKIWERFRAAFDHFYSKKKADFQQKKKKEKVAVTAKEQVIAQLNQLRDIEDGTEVFKQLKILQAQWVQAGFVSGKAFSGLQKKYQEVSDFLFNKFKRSSDEMKTGMMKDHYESLSSAPDGNQKLQFEERKIRERMSKISSELATLENNMNFFKYSKNAGEVIKQFETNISKAKEQIAKYEKELNMIRSLKQKNA